MDENIINLIRNRISNDYCKLMCDEIIEEKSKLIMESYIIGLMIYCMIYDIPYFVEYIYKENTQNNILKEQEQINILYLYYLEKNNKEDINLKNKILETTKIPVTIPDYGENYNLDEQIRVVSKLETTDKYRFLRLEVIDRLSTLKEELAEMSDIIKEDIFDEDKKDEEILAINDKIKELEQQIVRVIS